MAFRLVARGEGDCKTRYRPQRLSEICPTFPMKEAQAILSDPHASRVHLFGGLTGSGKCLGEGTLVLMADGRTIPVEQVRDGDRLMGPDGTARVVTSTTKGRGPLYRIEPVKGEPWVCNDVHILTLVHTSTGKVVDIALDDYLEQSAGFKHQHKLFSVGIDEFEDAPSYSTEVAGEVSADAFTELRGALGLTQDEFGARLGVGQTTISRLECDRGTPSQVVVEKALALAESEGVVPELCDPLPVRIDPYFLGVWFGDGGHVTSELADGTPVVRNVSVSKPDPEIRAICEETAREWGLRIRTTVGRSGCPTYNISNPKGRQNNKLLYELRLLVGPDLLVPDAIMRGPRSLRLDFLAGFLDTDGHLNNNCFNITQKREDWARAIWFIARSLGLRATWSTRTVKGYEHKGSYYRVSISGDTDLLPTRIPRKQASPRQQKKNALRIGFKVVSIGDDVYYGFTLTGDGRFLLGDFTVTHNTTLARIISRALVCICEDEAVEKPCLECPTCEKMEHIPDYYEINAANFSGKDDTRKKIANMGYVGNYFKGIKIYVFDEVHGLSGAAQELLLKVLEEPSKGTRIFLCTTHVKGCKRTFLGRCATLNFRRMTLKQASSIVQQICEDTGTALPNDATIEALFHQADGSVRDLLNLMDKVVMGSFEPGVGLEVDESEQGSPDIRQILDALKNKNWSSIQTALSTENVKNEPEGYRQTICDFLRREALRSSNIDLKVARVLGLLSGSLADEPRNEQYNILVLRCMRACYTK